MSANTPVEFPNLHLGEWDDNRWCKEGASCFYKHSSGQVLPCQILRFEYKHGGVLWRAYCNAMSITGRYSGRFIPIGDLRKESA